MSEERERSRRTPVLNSKKVIRERSKMAGREDKKGVAIHDTESSANCMSCGSSDQARAFGRRKREA